MYNFEFKGSVGRIIVLPPVCPSVCQQDCLWTIHTFCGVVGNELRKVPFRFGAYRDKREDPGVGFPRLWDGESVVNEIPPLFIHHFWYPVVSFVVRSDIRFQTHVNHCHFVSWPLLINILIHILIYIERSYSALYSTTCSAVSRLWNKYIFLIDEHLLFHCFSSASSKYCTWHLTFTGSVLYLLQSEAPMEIMNAGEWLTNLFFYCMLEKEYQAFFSGSHRQSHHYIMFNWFVQFSHHLNQQ